jgi:hypothetical protein
MFSDSSSHRSKPQLAPAHNRRTSGRTTACPRKRKKRMCRLRSGQSEFPHCVVVNGSTQISASRSYTCSGQREFPHRVSFETVTCFRLDFWKSCFRARGLISTFFFGNPQVGQGPPSVAPPRNRNSKFSERWDTFSPFRPWSGRSDFFWMHEHVWNRFPRVENISSKRVQFGRKRFPGKWVEH